MNKLNLLQKTLYFLNVLFAFLLLLSLIVPYIPPIKFPLLSVLSLVVAPLILVQLLFLLYWLLRLKRQVLLPLLILLICFVQFNSFYRVPFFNSTNQSGEQTVKVMSYNVHSFNINRWIDNDSIVKNIDRLIRQANPDIIAFQEYHTQIPPLLAQYTYRYVKTKGKSKSFGQAIYSKYPIVAKGSLNFKSNGNNAIYADIVVRTDTLRVYNLHMESLNLTQSDIDFNQEASKRLVKRISNSFVIQQQQMEQVVAHKEKSPYPSIVAADLNNTAFSYTYRKINKNMNDTFAESGTGLGTTFKLKHIPLRIDFILADTRFVTHNYTTYNAPYSDHFPIMAVIALE